MVTCLTDYAEQAKTILPPEVWDYVEGGAGDEQAVRANTAAFRSTRVLPRVLSGGGKAGTATTLLGTSADTPLAVAPMAYQALLHPDGEAALARAASAAGVPFVVPMLSSVALEDVAESGAELWLQLYWPRERAVLRDLVARAEDSGVRALVLTVDLPVMGRRLRDLRNAFALPPHIRAANLDPAFGAAARTRRDGASAIAGHTTVAFEPALGWSDVEWLRGATELPLVLKGVLDPRDAALAVEAGVSGVVVSNHGGRQLDRAVPALTALPAVRDAVAGRCAVLLDGGVRSGSDILCALARGADAVLVGRPLLWALACGGEDPARDALGLLADELATALTVSGCRDLTHARALTVSAG
ncbi:alpha-hydroxy acid oxidase [Saccharomonospora piscinae]|uniref:alpha-hydroxy acid oxidase n=1 Tax=Saccharomonospora piscinae TaxID=687388 RepID=UPI000464F9BA|nr:alpha-hydroxy acid oxidase [Saccharomonospora piscinae]